MLGISSAGNARRKAEGLVACAAFGAGLLLAGQSAFADVPAVSADVDGHEVNAVASERSGENYLFLPSSSKSYVSLDTSGGTVSWSNDEAGTYTTGPVFVQTPGTERTVYVKVNDGAPQKLVIMRSANVNSVFFDSSDPVDQGRAFVDVPKALDHRAPGKIAVVDKQGEVKYQGDVKEIKTRGNSTNQLPKKPYQIKLDKKGDMIPEQNAGKAKKWILLAEFDDPTEMHNRTSYSTAIALGLSTSECSESVDFYYDGDYRGTYTLTEKVEVGKTRVDINDMEDDETGNKSDDDRDLSEHPVAVAQNKYGREFHYVEGVKAPDDITGGYLLEKDDAFYKDERSWFDTSKGHFVLKSPEDASKEEVEYISEKVQRAIDEAQKYDGDISKYFDVESLAKTWLIEDFAKNCDYGNWSSTYFSVDKGEDSKIVAGPIWDHDLTFGTRRNAQGKDNAHWSRGVGYPQYVFFFNNKQFQQKLVDTWPEYSKIISDGVLADKSSIKGVESISEMTDEMRASMAMNGGLWGVDCAADCAKYGVKVTEDVQVYPVWQQNVDFFKRFASDRYSWMSDWMKTIQPGKTAGYRIDHYSVTTKGKVNRFDSEVEFAPIGSTITARPVSQEVVDTTTRYPGYVYDASYGDARQSDVVKPDGSAEVSCYYLQPSKDSKPTSKPAPSADTGGKAPAEVGGKATVKKGDKVTVKNGQDVALKYVVTSVKSRTVSVAGLGTKAPGKLSVPDTVKIADETYKVTAVSNRAFANQKRLSKVSFGSNVTTIGSKAFWHDSALSAVATGGKISKLGDSAFSGAKKLKTISIKSKNLGSKKAVKGCFKGSSVKTVKVKIGSKATNEKYAKKYRKVFTKNICGKKVTVK